MKAFILLLALAVSVGAVCYVFVWSQPHDALMGNAAPTIGSSPDMSSLEKFAVGKWVGKIEKPEDNPYAHIEPIVKLLRERMILKPDKTFTYDRLSHTVTGTWSCFEGEIRLVPSAVDGVSLQQVQLDYDHYNAVVGQRPIGTKGGPIDMSPSYRYDALQAVKKIALQVASDKKRLTDVQHGSLQMFWYRARN